MCLIVARFKKLADVVENGKLNELYLLSSCCEFDLCQQLYSFGSVYWVSLLIKLLHRGWSIKLIALHLLLAFSAHQPVVKATKLSYFPEVGQKSDVLALCFGFHPGAASCSSTGF